MSNIQKQMHDICQPIIAEHYADFTDFNSDGMKKAYAAVYATYIQGKNRAIRSAYDGEDEGMIESIIENATTVSLEPDAVPEELSNIYKGIIDECEMYRYADKCYEDYAEENDSSYEYDNDDYEHFDDYGYVDDDDDEEPSEVEDYGAVDYDLFCEDVVADVVSEADSMGFKAETAALIAYTGYYVSKKDYYTAMCYVNLLFIPELPMSELRSYIMNESIGELKERYCKKSAYIFDFDIHAIKHIAALLNRMHNYEKTHFDIPNIF